MGKKAKNIRGSNKNSSNKPNNGNILGSSSKQTATKSTPNNSDTISNNNSTVPTSLGNKSSQSTPLNTPYSTPQGTPHNTPLATPLNTPHNTPTVFLSDRKRKLERQMSADTLSSFLLTRPTLDEVSRSAELNSRVSPSISQNRKKIERRLSAHKISDHLKTRPSPVELEQNKGIVAGIGIFDKLDRKLPSDVVLAFHERSRPRRQQSIDIVKEDAANSMLLQAGPESVTLSRRMCRDVVDKMLARKQSSDLDGAEPVKMQEEKVKRAKIAPSLQSTHRVLERKMSSDNVKSLLENRPSVDQLRQ